MAVRLDATTERLHRTANLPSSTSFTICGWAQQVSTSGFQCIASLTQAVSSPSNALEFNVDAGTLEVNTYGGGSTVALPAIDETQPFFWALTNSGAGVGLCVGYARAFSANSLDSAASIGLSFTPAAFGIGDNGWGEAFNGSIWNVKAWDRVLTPQELLQESYCREVKYPLALNFAWLLDTSAQLRDSSKNQRHPTVTGTLTTSRGLNDNWRLTPRRVYKAPVGGGPTGTAAITLDALTVSGTGAVALRGTAAITLDALTVAGTGTLPLVGTAAITLDALTAAGTGALAIVGAASNTLDALTAAGTGALAVAGTAAITLDALTVAGTGTLGAGGGPITGTLTKTLDDLTTAGTGALAIVASTAVALEALIVAGTGALAIVGTGAATLGDLAAVGTGVLPIQAVLNTTLDGLVGSGSGKSPLIAAAAITLDDLLASGQGNLPAVGTLSATLQDLSMFATGRDPNAAIGDSLSHARSMIVRAGHLLSH